MFLKKVDYYEFKGKPNYWEIKDVNLGKINLIVGQNAAGKSRLMAIIWNLTRFLKKRTRLVEGNWDLQFADDNTEYIYHLKLVDGIVDKEKITKNGNIMLDRDRDRGEIYYETQRSLRSFAPPSTELTLHSRRDRVDHGFLEDLNDWANSFYGYQFTNINPQKITIVPPDQSQEMLSDLSSVPSLLSNALRTNPNISKKIIEDISKVGYPARKIWVEQAFPGIGGEVSILNVQEKDLLCQTTQNSISQGMYRAISTIIIINVILQENRACTIAIDDISEGLDYDRSIKLKKLLFKKVKGSNIQLIITSNDRFLINATDLRMINILDRKKQKVIAYNYKNSKDKFDAYDFTGLNTFDFFSRKIYKEKID